jgi:hypothetical protein
MSLELYRKNTASRGLGGTSMGQKASQTKIKSMIKSDWHAMRGEPGASTKTEKQANLEVAFAKTVIHREILKRLDGSA